MHKKLEEMVDNFCLFDDWEERYRYLIDLGNKLPHMDEEDKKDEYLVRGCTSRVWFIPNVKDDGIFEFQADSDAHIVRGLIMVLVAAYEGIAVSGLGEVDIKGAFERMGMDQHLSINRRNGFFSVVEKIRDISRSVPDY